MEQLSNPSFVLITFVLLYLATSFISFVLINSYLKDKYFRYNLILKSNFESLKLLYESNLKNFEDLANRFYDADVNYANTYNKLLRLVKNWRKDVEFWVAEEIIKYEEDKKELKQAYASLANSYEKLLDKNEALTAELNKKKRIKKS